jgi:hypothetical protein
MTLNDFRVVAKELGTKIAWTDEELLQAINVHQCLLAYFRERGEGMISFALQMELNTLESYAFHRKWNQNGDTWQIRRKDGTLA